MIRILQHYTKTFIPLIGVSKPIHQEYADIHGYSFHLKQVPSYPVYNGLEKLNQILEVCKEGDVALVLDADCIITNHLLKVEIFLENDKDFFICEGLNAGVFIIRKTVWSSVFIHTLIEQISLGNYHCEQDAIEGLINNRNISRMTKVLPHPAFNSYLSELYPEVPQPVTEEQGQWVEGKSFILHLPALPLEKRLSIMQSVKITK